MPVGAIKSLVDAVRGKGPTFYRIQYQLASGRAGQLIWFEDDEPEPAIVLNDREFHFPNNAQFVKADEYALSTEARRFPLIELEGVTDAEDPEGETIVSVPNEFRGKRIPPVDNREAFGFDVEEK